VVIAIIAILASMLIPALGGARKKAQSAACLNNLKQIAVTYFLYSDDEDGIMPSSYIADTFPTNSSGLTSRWAWWGNDNATAVYADILIDNGYVGEDSWDCPSVDITTSTPSGIMPMPEYGMSGYFNTGAAMPNNNMNSDYGLPNTYNAQYRLHWWDTADKGFLLSDTGGDNNNFPFTWQIHWGADGETRHGNYQNVVFFDGHAAGMIAPHFWPSTTNGGLGTWKDTSVTTLLDIPYIAWRPSIHATN
jgi:prepilin-type processing-associated H-X9-DG protein